jgi:hypothetical protein
MDSNNNHTGMESGNVAAGVEPPPQMGRVVPGAQVPQGSAPPLEVPTYRIYPQPEVGAQAEPQVQPQWQQPVFPPQPAPVAPATGHGVDPLVLILSILGGLVVLGAIFAVTMAFLFTNIFSGASNAKVGPLVTETQAVALGDAKSVVVNINMGVGDLKVSGGSSDLMNATFDYNVAAWKPEIAYSVVGTQGTLQVEQPSQRVNNPLFNSGGSARYDWDLRFMNEVPMTMRVALGVGKGTLKFGGLNLSRLEVNTGVGDTTLDLSGQWKQDTSVLVNGGLGQVSIIVPKDAGVHATVEGGLGHINAGGLTVNGNTYTNAAYGTSPTTINIDVKTGIGNVNLIQEK